MRHSKETRPCSLQKTVLLPCTACPDTVFKGEFLATTVSQLIAERDTTRSNFFMFFASGCHGFPTTMPPYLKSVLEMDSIAPVMVIVDEYVELSLTRARIGAWGWKGPVHVLDQDHYGCFRFFASNRDSLVMHEFGIEEPGCYYCTVSLEVMVDKHGKVTGYSNYHDLPGALRGKNIPK